MTIARTVIDCLQTQRVAYEVIAHRPSGSSLESAALSHVAAGSLAKAVVLADAAGYVMAVIPANSHLDLEQLSRVTGRRLTLVPEDRLPRIFRDCAPGAIPPLGPAYGLETVVEDCLIGQAEVYFEGGDHEELVRVAGEQFLALLKDARHGHFSH